MSLRKVNFKIFPERFGYFPYVFLMYLFLPAYFIVLESGWKMFIGWGLLLLFFISYRQLYSSFESKSFTFWLIVQMGIIFIFTVYYNVNNVFLGFFTSYFLGWYRNNKLFLLVYILFAIILLFPLISRYEDLIHSGSYAYLIYLIIMLIVPFGIKSMNSRIELEEKLTEANEKIEELVKRDERMRISRDLHDTLGHTLSLITLKAQLVSKLTEKDAKLAGIEAKEIERTSRIALTQVRELVSDMRTVSIAEALAASESILQSAGISYHMKEKTDTLHIPSITQNILSMCIKEAVTNVVKHSEAKKCYILLKQITGKIQLVIEDDGVGFQEHTDRGNGLRGMSERLELVDGNLEIRSTKGIQLVFTIPLVVREEEAGVSE